MRLSEARRAALALLNDIEKRVATERKGEAVRDKRSGVLRIADERLRQIKEEGWTKEHDVTHQPGDLAIAGACYAQRAESVLAGWSEQFANVPPRGWPCERRWWKPSDPIRDLEKAGALIAAEIDRILALREEVGP